MTALFELDILLLEALVALKKVAEKVGKVQEMDELTEDKRRSLQECIEDLQNILSEVQDSMGDGEAEVGGSEPGTSSTYRAYVSRYDDSLSGEELDSLSERY